MKHTPEFEKLLERGGIRWEELEPKLIATMQRFNQCLYLLEQREPNSDTMFWKVLIQADAVLTAAIYQRFREKLEPTKLDKIKQMALKAKALKAKWSKQS